MTLKNNKSLGQNWLRDRVALAHIADCAELSKDDVVLEIGPGLGTLTSELLRRAKKVIAVEYDQNLAQKLPGQFPGKDLIVINADILQFDLSTLPENYKVVANIPYYITSKIVQMLVSAKNKPAIAVLLVQKEVAERLAAEPGDLSVLGISAQIYAEVFLGEVVPAELFTPPPKVDSQVVILKMRPESLLGEVNKDDFLRVVKAGFSEKRKKLRSSLANSLRLPKADIENILHQVGIGPDDRAENLSIDDWLNLTVILNS
jgi:16S rRNA (adenine1518-N6/adenine1519-N6)-dimethyltransferase